MSLMKLGHLCGQSCFSTCAGRRASRRRHQKAWRLRLLAAHMHATQATYSEVGCTPTHSMPAQLQLHSLLSGARIQQCPAGGKLQSKTRD
jgi:hypothetical protein